jgi:hypothetical protein
MAQAVVAVVSIVQSGVILVVAGPGPQTDAFLAVYMAYIPLGTLAATIRISGIPMSVDRAGVRSEARIAHLGIALAVGLAVISPLLVWALTRSLPPSVWVDAELALLILAVAAGAQIMASGYSARLSGRGRLTTSNLVYAASGLAGVAISVAAALVVGAIGVAIGVAATAVMVLLAHLRLVADRPRQLVGMLLLDRTQFRLLRVTVLAALIPVAVQIHLILALPFAPAEPSAITGITYSFIFLSLLLGSSFQVVGALGLSRVSGVPESQRPAAVEQLVRVGVPAAFGIAAPVAVVAVVAGPAIADLVPSAVISPELLDRIFAYLGPMVLVALPWGVQTLLFSCAVARGLTSRSIAAVLLSFVVLLAVLAALGSPTRDEWVGALLVTELIYVSMLWILIFRRRSIRVGWRTLAGSAPVLALCGGLLALGYDRSPAFVAVATVAALALLVRGRRAHRALDAWVAQGHPGVSKS